MQLNNKKVNLVILASSLFLVACGGDSGSDIEKPDPAKTLAETDFNNQIFIVKGNEQVANSFTFFSKSKTGVEFTGNFESLVEKNLTWEIKDKTLNVTYNQVNGGGEYSFSREKLDSNIYTGRKDGKISYLHKGLPFTLGSLNKKVIKFIKPGGCAEKNDVRTLKVAGNKATLKQICAGVKAYPVTFSVKVKSDMVNTLEFIELREQGVGKHILMSLIKGDVKKSGSGSDPKLPTEISMVYLNEKNLTTERIEIVNKEAPSK